MRFTLALMTALAFAPPTVAQSAYTTLNWGLDRTVTPYAFGANIGGVWRNLGTVSSAGVWAIPASNLSFTQAGGGAAAQTIDNKLKVMLNAADYLSASQLSGSADATSSLQAAINGICARSPAGGILYFPPGRILAHDISISCPVSLSGARGKILGAGTTIDVSASTSFGIRYRPTGWPAVTHQNLIYGPIVENLNFYSSSSGSATARVIEFDGIHGGVMRNVAFSGTIYDAIKLYGVYKFDLDNISANYYPNVGPSVSNTFLEIYGDLSGKSRAGASCTNVGDCSTRTDIVSLRQVDYAGTNTGTGIWIHGISHTTVGEHIFVNNKYIGLKISCEIGFSNISACPSFTSFTDFEAEGAVYESMQITDFTDFQCFGCYARADGGSANHAVEIGLVNYSASAGAGGGFRWVGGRMVNSGGSAFYSTAITDITIANSYLFAANISNIGASGVEIASGSAIDIHDNTFCRLVSDTPTAMGGVIIGSTVSNISVRNNKFWGCNAAITNSSSSVNTIRTSGNEGPNAQPAIDSCGTSAEISAGVDSSFLLKIGTGSPSSCSVNFGNPISSVVPRCTSMATTGSTNVATMTTSATAVTLASPTSGGSYMVTCSWN